LKKEEEAKGQGRKRKNRRVIKEEKGRTEGDKGRRRKKKEE